MKRRLTSTGRPAYCGRPCEARSITPNHGAITYGDTPPDYVLRRMGSPSTREADQRPRRDVDVARVAALRAEGPVAGVEWVITMVWCAHPRAKLRIPTATWRRTGASFGEGADYQPVMAKWLVHEFVEW